MSTLTRIVEILDTEITVPLLCAAAAVAGLSVVTFLVIVIG
jgi:hypothetical protein